MSLVLIGTNHKNSGREFRERLSLTRNQQRDILTEIKESGYFKGGVILSTCNRVEYYLDMKDEYVGTGLGKRKIQEIYSLDYGDLEDRMYISHGQEVITHLYKVSSGIDSMILGETEIKGQVKNSLNRAKNTGATTRKLQQIFQDALNFATRAHKETSISKGKTSVGSVAVDFIEDKTDGLDNKNILIIGTGKVSRLVLQYLSDENAKVIFIANRTYKKAQKLAKSIDGKAVKFDKLNKLLSKADIVVSATSAPHKILKKERINKVKPGSTFLLDLAVPRDIDSEIEEFKHIDLYTLEDIETIIEQNKASKQREAEKIKKLILKQVDNYEEKIKTGYKR